MSARATICCPTRTERAAFILREAFDYSYRDIVTRARQHVANGRRMLVSSNEHRRLLDAFVAAVRHGDVAALEGFLTSDVVSTSASAVAA